MTTVNWTALQTASTVSGQQRQKRNNAKLVNIVEGANRRLENDEDDVVVAAFGLALRGRTDEAIAALYPNVDADTRTAAIHLLNGNVESAVAALSGNAPTGASQQLANVPRSDQEETIPLLDEDNTQVSEIKVATVQAHPDRYVVVQDSSGTITGVRFRNQFANQALTQVPQGGAQQSTTLPVFNKKGVDTGRKLSYDEGFRDRSLEVIRDHDGKAVGFKESSRLVRR